MSATSSAASFNREGEQAGQLAGGGRQAQVAGDGGGDVGGERLGEVQAGHALRDRPVEEAGGAGHGHQRGDAAGSRGLAEDGDPAGVSAEGGDVVLDPAERGDLVQEPAVGRRSGEVPEALGAQAVVEGHHDDAVTGQGGAVEEGIAGPAVDVASAVDPHHHRQAGGAEVGGPDVDGQPVAVGVPRGGCAHHAGLRRRRPEGDGLAHALPRFDGHRRGQAQLAHRRASERHATEDGQAVLRPPAHAARGEANVRACGSGGVHRGGGRRHTTRSLA